MKEYNYEEFISNCDILRCLRNTITNKKTCAREYKREKCFRNYNQKREKYIKKINQKDTEWEFVRKTVWIRDAGYYDSNNAENINWKKYCRLWAVLDKNEKDFVEKHFSANLWLNKHLDCAHILRKGIKPEFKYDINNVVLIGRYFHNLLDQYKNPLTKTPISDLERSNWFSRIKINR